MDQLPLNGRACSDDAHANLVESGYYSQIIQPPIQLPNQKSSGSSDPSSTAHASKGSSKHLNIPSAKWERVLRSIHRALYGPLKEQGLARNLWGLALVSLESLAILFKMQKNIAYLVDFLWWAIPSPACLRILRPPPGEG